MANIGVYYSEIKKNKSLSIEEESELIRLYQNNGDNDALNKLLLANLRFVVSMAMKYYETNVDLNDLISEGNMGLIKAAERFDYNQGVKFITYAVHWVKNEIQVFINKVKSFEYNEVDKDDISDETSDLIEDNISIIDRLLEEESKIKSLSNKVLDYLNEQERDIITYFYGINTQNNEEISLKEIGVIMGMSSERIRQIKDKAIMKIRMGLVGSEMYNEINSILG